jgi:Protein of unknown function (DUF1861)
VACHENLSWIPTPAQSKRTIGDFDVMVTADVRRVSQYFKDFECGRQSGRATGKLTFAGVNGLDVYNITAPFSSASLTAIAGRVEPRDQELSTVVFFQEKNGAWHPVPGAPTFQLQDPFVTFISNELVFGGVRTYPTEHGLGWKTILYRGADIFSLTQFFAGPNGMKDIRLCDMTNGNISVFTRPQGVKGGLGTIGYTQCCGLDALSCELIEAAPLIEHMFHPSDWGGANETHLLPNGDIGVLGHAACYENDDKRQVRHYYSTAFTFNPGSLGFRDYKIIASRDQFIDGPAKRPDLLDVIFSSGLVRRNGTARLYAGVSDAEAHWIDIPDPFL